MAWAGRAKYTAFGACARLLQQPGFPVWVWVSLIGGQRSDDDAPAFSRRSRALCAAAHLRAYFRDAGARRAGLLLDGVLGTGGTRRTRRRWI